MEEVDSARKLPLTREQLAAILDGAADGVIVRDAAGQLVYANDAAAHLCGYGSRSAMLSASPDEPLSRFALLDLEGGPLAPDQLPGHRVLGGQGAPESMVRFRVLETGEERWSVVHSTPIQDAAGRLELAVSLLSRLPRPHRTHHQGA
jgi:PAS domain-containing protein